MWAASGFAGYPSKNVIQAFSPFRADRNFISTVSIFPLQLLKFLLQLLEFLVEVCFLDPRPLQLLFCILGEPIEDIDLISSSDRK